MLRSPSGQTAGDPLVEVVLVEAPLALNAHGPKNAAARGLSKLGALHEPIDDVVGGQENVVVREAGNGGHGVAFTLVSGRDSDNKANGRAGLSRRLYESLLLRGEYELEAAIHAELVVHIV